MNLLLVIFIRNRSQKLDYSSGASSQWRHHSCFLLQKKKKRACQEMFSTCSPIREFDTFLLFNLPKLKNTKIITHSRINRTNIKHNLIYIGQKIRAVNINRHNFRRRIILKYIIQSQFQIAQI